MGSVGSGAPDDPYWLLGIAPDADDATLRRAWRRLALQWHPDRAGAAATETFQRLQAAYTVLSDPEARAAHDRRADRRAGAALRPAGEPERRRAPREMLRRLSGPLNALLAQGVARHLGEGLIELVLNAQEVAEGGMVTLSMRVPVRCGATGTTEELFSAWLTVPPGVADGAVLRPSVLLRGMVHAVSFRIRHQKPRQA
jgi:curved DNA-binding protein CbpA